MDSRSWIYNLQNTYWALKPHNSLLLTLYCPDFIEPRSDTDRYSRGEKTAQALEANLTSLEKKIDDLLASFEESERLKVEEANSKRTGQGEGKASGDPAKN